MFYNSVHLRAWVISPEERREGETNTSLRPREVSGQHPAHWIALPEHQRYIPLKKSQL